MDLFTVISIVRGQHLPLSSKELAISLWKRWRKAKERICQEEAIKQVPKVRARAVKKSERYPNCVSRHLLNNHMTLSSMQQNKWKQVLCSLTDGGVRVWTILGPLQTMSSSSTPREKSKLEHLVEDGARRLLCQALVPRRETFRSAGSTTTTRKWRSTRVH